MTSQSEQFGCINSKRSFESQNYLSGNILCITNDFSIEPTKYKQVPNKLVYKILIKEDFLTQNNLDNTIQKKTQAFVHRVTKQQNLSCKYQSVFNNLSNQIALVLNSDSTFQQKNNESLSSQNQNDIQLNKQSLEIQDLQNNAKQEFEKVILISKEGLNQNFDQIKECILDQLSSQKEIQKYVETQNQKENCFEKEYTIKQLVIESKFSDQFNQQNVQAYQDDSLSLNDNQNVNTEYLNDVDEDIQFRQYFTELMSQIQFDLSKKNYYLTELVDSSEYEDMYTGYQNKDSSQILLFKLFYYPSQQNKQIYRQNKDFENKQSKLIDLTDLQYQQIMYQDVEKLIMVIEWYEKSSLKSDRIIYVSNQAKILVMKQDNYNQILNKCSYLIDKIKRQDLNTNQYELSQSLFLLGESYRYLGINEESQRFLKEYLETINKIKLTKQQELQYLSQAIICYQSLNQFDIALEISEKYLLMNKSLLNQNPLEVFKSLYQVGECYKYLNKNEQALDFFNKSLEISQNIFKEENLKISKALIQIGACYFQLKNYKKALMFSLQSLEMNRKIFKKGHPYISQCLYKISECYSYQNDYQKALLFSLKSLDIYKKFFEEDHQEVQKVNEQISKCYQHIK
ncbi:hypothetical protein ABPG73_006418 [Tetrahymena malaccensis]